jgi:hypothetical protein
MYNEAQIKEILTEKIAIFKESEARKKAPEFTEVYQESVEYLERICIHSEIGKFPEKLFKMRAPNQTQEEFDYIKCNHKTVTFPIWAKFINTLNRIWNDANWSIKWPEYSQQDGETPQRYLEKDYPVYGSLENYYKTIVTRLKEKDPNAVICHKPYTLPVIMKGDELVIDESKYIEPIAVIYESPQIIGFLEKQYALIELNEKSWVIFGNREEKTGKVFEFYDDQNIWRVIQTGKKTDYKFDIVLFWPHKLGYLPCSKLKAVPIPKENSVLYQSHFMSAVEIMDDILLDSSYLKASKATHAFPQKWEYADECDYQQEGSMCVNGVIFIDGGEKTCPSCQGSGKKSMRSPMGVTQVKAPTNYNNESEKLSIPPGGYVSPDPGILDFLRKEIELNKGDALSILNLNTSSSEVKGSETALGKLVDREDMFTVILSISNQVFELFGFSIKCNIQMRYGKDENLPILCDPRTFSIRNEYDLTEEISKAKENGLPDIAIRQLLIEYLYTRFSTQEETTKMVDLAFAVDRLISLSTQDITQKKLSGSVANWEDILHTSVYTFIAEQIQKDPDFLNQPLEKQKSALVKMAKAKDSEVRPQLVNVDSVLAGANGETPVDVEAEAKANLKGSVGGVQGLIQIQTSVSQGITDYEAAVTMLFEIYGFDDATARKLLGNPVDLKPTEEKIK